MNVTYCDKENQNRSRRADNKSCKVPMCDRAAEDVRKQPHFTKEFNEEKIETYLKELLRNYAVIKDGSKLAIKLPDEGLFRFEDVSQAKDHLVLQGTNEDKEIRRCKFHPSDRHKLDLLGYM